MGMSADAELIWGIPVLAYVEDSWDEEREGYAVTQFWDEDSEWWRDLPGELEIHNWGHIEDPDNMRGILTSTRMERFSADCWDAVQISSNLPDEAFYDKIYSKSSDQAREAGLDVNFYFAAGWWLVCSYG